MSFTVQAFNDPRKSQKQTDELFNYLNLRAKLNKQTNTAMKQAAAKDLTGVLPSQLPTTSNAENVSNKFQLRDAVLVKLDEVLDPTVAHQMLQHLESNGDLEGFNIFFPKFKDEIKSLKGSKLPLIKSLWETFKRRTEAALSPVTGKPLLTAAAPPVPAMKFRAPVLSPGYKEAPFVKYPRAYGERGWEGEAEDKEVIEVLERRAMIPQDMEQYRAEKEEKGLNGLKGLIKEEGLKTPLVKVRPGSFESKRIRRLAEIEAALKKGGFKDEELSDAYELGVLDDIVRENVYESMRGKLRNVKGNLKDVGALAIVRRRLADARAEAAENAALLRQAELDAIHEGRLAEENLARNREEDAEYGADYNRRFLEFMAERRQEIAEARLEPTEEKEIRRERRERRERGGEEEKKGYEEEEEEVGPEARREAAKALEEKVFNEFVPVLQSVYEGGREINRTDSNKLKIIAKELRDVLRDRLTPAQIDAMDPDELVGMLTAYYEVGPLQGALEVVKYPYDVDADEMPEYKGGQRPHFDDSRFTKIIEKLNDPKHLVIPENDRKVIYAFLVGVAGSEDKVKDLLKTPEGRGELAKEMLLEQAIKREVKLPRPTRAALVNLAEDLVTPGKVDGAREKLKKYIKDGYNVGVKADAIDESNWREHLEQLRDLVLKRADELSGGKSPKVGSPKPQSPKPKSPREQPSSEEEKDVLIDGVPVHTAIREAGNIIDNTLQMDAIGKEEKKALGRTMKLLQTLLGDPVKYGEFSDTEFVYLTRQYSLIVLRLKIPNGNVMKLVESNGGPVAFDKAAFRTGKHTIKPKSIIANVAKYVAELELAKKRRQ